MSGFALGWAGLESFIRYVGPPVSFGTPSVPSPLSVSTLRCNHVDEFGDHALHCSSRPGYEARHDHVRDVLASLFREAGVSVVKEAKVSFPSPSSSTPSPLRPADILLPAWTQGKSTCGDVTGVSSFVRTSGGAWLGSMALSSAVSRNLAKHQLSCVQNGFVFLPFAFDTFGGFSPEAVSLLCRLHRSLVGFMYSRDIVVVRYI